MEKRQYNEERVDLIVGIITIAIFLSLFLWMLISIGNNSRNTAGAIASEQELRRGSEQTLCYTIDKADIKDGTKVEWTVNGKKVGESTYTKGEPVTFNYTPEYVGTIAVKARVGKYSQMTMLEVKSPRLTVTAPNITVTYGDQMPEINCVVEGFVEGEEGEIDCTNMCKIDAEKLNVGVYTVEFCKECSYMDYETEYVTGTLTVLPRTLNVVEQFDKVYDGTNTICNPEINLVGVKEGDDVNAQCDTLYFDSKNAGERQIMLANVELIGADACNYVLNSYAHGKIMPKCIDIVGLTVKDKIYDGTTRATIDTMGTIKGVCEGDSVAIGNISVSFEDASVGEQNFNVSRVSLVGADKDNYRIGRIETGSGNINSTLMQRLTQRDPVAQGAN
ncbi:MAG: hypothetical protein J1F66_02395 [Clostridiales bacterium]|nr:hypothetical protein [Clostridiales bacterium]